MRTSLGLDRSLGFPPTGRSKLIFRLDFGMQMCYKHRTCNCDKTFTISAGCFRSTKIVIVKFPVFNCIVLEYNLSHPQSLVWRECKLKYAVCDELPDCFRYLTFNEFIESAE